MGCWREESFWRRRGWKVESKKWNAANGSWIVEEGKKRGAICEICGLRKDTAGKSSVNREVDIQG